MANQASPRERARRPATAAIVFQGELDYISRCILDYPEIETGGELFGYWTAAGEPVVLYAIGPGPRANHEVAFFNQDLEYLVAVGRRLGTRFGLQHIGEWHSHHCLGLAQPSGHDASTIARGVADQGLGRFLLAIGTCVEGRSDLRAYTFHEDFGNDWNAAGWDVRAGESPFRAVADADEVLAVMLAHPSTQHANAVPPPAPAGTRPPAFQNGHWLSRRDNHAVLKAMVDFLVAGEDDPAKVALGDGGAIKILISRKEGEERIELPPSFPDAPPAIALPTAGETPTQVEWPRTGDIFSDFTEYYNQTVLGGEECRSETETDKEQEP